MDTIEIDLTPELMATIQRYEVATADFRPGLDSTLVVEGPLVEIGTCVVQAVGLPSLQALFDRALGPRRAADA